MSEVKPKKATLIKQPSSSRGSFLVAAGIFLSRIFGLVRMRVLAHFLGDSNPADAFYAAIKIPNFLQNLLGEGVLSASFIPVYANLISKGDRVLADKLASAILSLLAVVVAVLVSLGVLATPLLIDILAPGFEGEKRELTILLVQILFPGTGVLVFSAWCLGILNSHHKFFLSYVAPVFSNLAVIGVLIYFRLEPDQKQLAVYASWGLVLGAVLQLIVQLPTTLKLVSGLRFHLSTRLPEVRTVVKNFVPVVTGRGVIQFSAYVDSILASFLPSGAVAAIGYAQTIYMLPVSLFGMSISAAELPSMSQSFGEKDFALTLQKRVNTALRRLSFFVIPSVVGFLILGDVVVGLLFETGQFNRHTTFYVWTVLVGYSIGIMASTQGRLYASVFYALRDTKTPLRFSILRVLLATTLGWFMGLKLPGLLGFQETWGTMGLTAAAGLSGWVEFMLLKRGANRLIGTTGLPQTYALKLWSIALLSAISAFFLKRELQLNQPVIQGLVIGGTYTALYLGLTRTLK